MQKLKDHKFRAAGWLIFAAAVVLVGCARETGTPSTAETALQGISPRALEAHVRFLADDHLQGRMTGSAEYAIAANYVESQFRQIGLQPKGTAGYLQAVPYASAMLDTASVRASLIGPSGFHELRWKTDFVAGADRVREHVAITAPAVFVGYGVHAPELGYDDFAGVDARGKILVMFRGAPPTFGPNERAYHSTGEAKKKAAVAHGAVGIATLRRTYDIEHYAWDEEALDAGVMPTMSWLSSSGTASDYYPELKAGLVLADAAAPLLFEGSNHSYAELLKLQAAGAELPHFDLPVQIACERNGRITKVSSPNVIGMLPGSDPKLAGEYLIFTAHLDHLGVGTPVNGDAIYNGAYDNAMGVSLIIEAARALAAARPGRSILFAAVSGEESGLLGSDYFAHYPTVPIRSIVAEVNIDMPLFIYPIADLIAYGSEHSTLEDTVRKAAAAEGLALSADPFPDEVFFIRSDVYSLVRQGVPAVDLITGLKSKDPAVNGEELYHEFLRTHYHHPSDDVSRPVDWESAARFARVNVRIALDAANAAQAPRWRKGNFFGNLFAADRRAVTP